MVKDLLHPLDIHRSKRLKKIHPMVFRELVKMFNKTLFVINQQSWITGIFQLTVICNVTSVYKRDCKKDPGNYRPLNLTSVLGKFTEQITIRPLYSICRTA